MNLRPFIFNFYHAVELPCGNLYSFTYQVEAQAEPQYSTSALTHVDYYDGLSFHIIGVDRVLSSGAKLPVNIYAAGEDMRRFRADLEEAARDYYERRNGATDFETVTIHDRVNGQDVTVYDNLQTV
jgi:hypothetical protein